MTTDAGLHFHKDGSVICYEDHSAAADRVTWDDAVTGATPEEAGLSPGGSAAAAPYEHPHVWEVQEVCEGCGDRRAVAPLDVEALAAALRQVPPGRDCDRLGDIAHAQDVAAAYAALGYEVRPIASRCRQQCCATIEELEQAAEATDREREAVGQPGTRPGEGVSAAVAPLDVWLIGLARHGYQPMYNGRPSCPYCLNFVDDEETHAPGCGLAAYADAIRKRGGAGFYDDPNAEGNDR